MTIVAAFLLLSFVAHAGDSGTVARGRSLCERSPRECSWKAGASDRVQMSAAQAAPPPTTPAPLKASRHRPSRATLPEEGPGNLPLYLASAERSASENQQQAIIVAEKPLGALLPGLRSGDILIAELEQSVKASLSVPTPVRARVTRGRFKGAFVLGTATFDRELKRILLTFERLRLPSNDTTYALKATGLAPSGQVGLEGDHRTQEGLYFAGEIVAATAAGFADATTQRSQTALGTYQTEPTLANAGKQGAVQALSKTAERFAERSRTAPEYTEIEAGREIQIIVETSPTEASGA